MKTNKALVLTAFAAAVSATAATTTTATAAVAAEIMPGRPPVKAITIAIATEA